MKPPHFLHPLLLALSSSILWMSAMFLGPLWFLAFVAHAPIALLYARRDKVPLVYGLAWASLAMLLGLHPTIRAYGIRTPFLLAPFHIFFFWPWVPLYLRWIYRRYSPPLALTLPPIFVACEFAWVRLEFNRLGMYSLGYALADHPLLIQLADLGGVYLLTFVLAAVSGASADLVRWAAHRGDPILAKSARRGLAVGGGLAAALVIYGVVRIDRAVPQQGPRVALVQPAMLHQINALYGVHVTQLLMTAEQVPPGSVDLILWPENSILDFLDRPGRYIEDIAWLARREKALVLLGAMGHARSDPFRTTNTAFLVDGEGRVRGAYDKIDVIPWAEYFPFESWLAKWAPSSNLRHLETVIGTVGYFPTGTAGAGMTLFDFDAGGRKTPFSVCLCSENIVPGRAREGAMLGASFLVNLTSEGDVGGLVQGHLLRVSRVRSVETHRPYVRVGNTGISAIIDANGRIASVLRGSKTGAVTGEAGVLRGVVPLLTTRRTFYTRVGDLFAWIASLSALVTVLFAVVRGWRRGRRRQEAMAVAAATAGLALAALALVGCGSAPPASPAEYEKMIERGREAFAKKGYRQALDLFLAASRAHPEDPTPYPYIAEIFRLSNSNGAGYLFFEDVLARGERAPGILVQDAFFQERLWRKREALALYREALEKSPGDRNALLRGIPLLLEMGDATAAVRVAASGNAARPGDPEILLLLARAQYESRDLEGAEATLARCERAKSDPERTALLLGYLRLAQHRDADAEAVFRAVHELDPRDQDSVYNLARLALRQDDLEKARTWLAELLRIEAAT